MLDLENSFNPDKWDTLYDDPDIFQIGVKMSTIYVSS